VTTKDGTLEDPEALASVSRRQRNSYRSSGWPSAPQCGFASSEISRTMTPAEQEAKLRLVGDVAKRIWA
jgi:5-methyltetrahydropteroyltriglutamate--homocysteine methyltransferase